MNLPVLTPRALLLPFALLVALAAALFTRPVLAQVTDCSTITFAEQSGTLPDGTPWGMRKPALWNGVLINDLDYVNNRNSARNCYWLGQGYATAGTNRHPLRTFQYDPAKEIQNLLAVIDTFTQTHGKPRRIIQYGNSGGGFVGLGFAELHPDRVDGVVAGCAHEQVPLLNMMFDGWFVLKALLAPDLQIANYTDLAQVSAAAAQWQAVIKAAQQTAEGRARIALAVAVGQWPRWSNAATPVPNRHDESAMQLAMFQTVLSNAGQPGGQSRFMSEHAGGSPPPMPRQLSWNTGFDYALMFERANNDDQRLVRTLYRDAGLRLESDLARVNAAPRQTVDQAAMSFWSQPGRTVHGTPKIPVLRIHTSGDNIVPPQIIDGYVQKMRANRGDERLYRTAVAESAGHCTFSVPENAAAIDALLERIETGRWPATSPDAMNIRALGLVPAGPARFIDYDPVRFNRAANSPDERLPGAAATTGR